MPKIKKKNPPKPVRPFYTVTQLSDIFQMSRLGTRKMLERLGLRMQFFGNRYVLFLSDIRDGSPELFASIQEAAHLNSQMAKAEDLSDSEFNSRHEFQDVYDVDWT